MLKCSGVSDGKPDNVSAELCATERGCWSVDLKVLTTKMILRIILMVMMVATKLMINNENAESDDDVDHKDD